MRTGLCCREPRDFIGHNIVFKVATARFTTAKLNTDALVLKRHSELVFTSLLSVEPTSHDHTEVRDVNCLSINFASN